MTAANDRPRAYPPFWRASLLLVVADHGAQMRVFGAALTASTARGQLMVVLELAEWWCGLEGWA